MAESDSSEIVKEQAESTSLETVASGGGAKAFYQSLAMGDAVAHQRAMSIQREAISGLHVSHIAKAAELLMATSPQEAAGESGILGQIAKILQQTPPPTDIPTQGK